MRLKKYIFLFLLIIFQTAVFGENISFSISWNGIQKVLDKELLSFDNAVYLNESELPCFSTKIPKYEDAEISIENIVWGDFSDEEKKLLAEKELPEKIVVEKYTSIHRKAKELGISFLPIIRDTLGNVKKALSFELVIEAKTSLRSEAPSLHKYKSSSVLSSGKWIKIRVPSSGIYKLTYSDLASMGISNPSSPRVFGYGGAILSEFNGKLNADGLPEKIDDLPEIAVWKSTAGALGANDYILFYTQGPVSWEYNAGKSEFEHTVNPYSNYGYYFVTSDAGEGKQIQTVAATTEIPSKDVNYFLDRQLHEKDQTSIIMSGREWYGEAFTNTTSQSFSFNFPNVSTTRASKLNVNIIASAAESSFATTVGGVSVGNVPVSGSTSDYIKALTSSPNPYPSFSFTPTGNTVTVSLRYNKPTSSSQGWLNFLRLNVYRNLAMYGDAMFFRNPDVIEANTFARYTLSSASDAIEIWDITDQSNNFRVSALREEGNLSFVAGVSKLREYVALNPRATNYPKPEIVGEEPNQNLHGLSEIDFVIISHKDFLTQAYELAQAHIDYDKMKVAVVTPEQVYNEFSSGTPDISAYKWLMKMLYDRAAGNENKMPKYLLLFGDGSYDNRKLITSTSQNKILTYQSRNSIVAASTTNGSYTCDDYLAYLDDNEGWCFSTTYPYTEDIKKESMDISVGRFTVNTPQEAANVTNKTIAYIQNTKKGPWKNQVCYLGDDGGINGKDGIQHMQHAEDLAKITAANYPQLQVTKLYMGAFQKENNASGGAYPDLREKLHNLIKKGVLFVNYSGHGSTESLSAKRIFTRGDVVGLKNDKLPIFLTATCDYSHYDQAKTSSGEELLLNPNGGAVALFSTSRTVYAPQNLALNKTFIQHAFVRKNGKQMRLGDVCRLAKNDYKDYNNLCYVLLGDPALLIPHPVDTVVTTEIIVDGEPSSEISALSIVEIKGEIQSHSGGKMNDFNGVLYVQVFDKEQSMKAYANPPNTAVALNYKDRNNMLFSGKATVENGDFSFKFLVPKDIAYNFGSGRINYYAADETNGYEANGADENFEIGGINPNAEWENDGPEIEMYLNTPKFVSGEKTHENPLFVAKVEDQSGINSAGVGIGHDIFLQLNNNPNLTYILNDFYEADLGSFKSGSISYQLSDLEEGKYTLFFRVWDVLNNSSSKTLEFEVIKGFKPNLYDISIRPNPVKTETQLIVTHDRPGSLIKADIQIIDLSGRLVHRQESSVFSEGYTTKIGDWNATSVHSGMYLCKVTLVIDEKSVQKTGKIIVNKQ